MNKQPRLTELTASPWHPAVQSGSGNRRDRRQFRGRLPKSPKLSASSATTFRIALLLLACMVCLWTTTTIAQDPATDAVDQSRNRGPNPVVSDATGIGKEPPLTNNTITLNEQTHTDTLETIDKGFGTIVDYMAKVLFYRVGASSEQYIVTQKYEYYWREPGSDGNFHALQPGRTYWDVTPKMAKALLAQGKLKTGTPDPETGRIRPWRSGLMGDRDESDAKNRTPVEYLTLIVDEGKKYVRTVENKQVTFRPVTKPRGRLNEDESTWWKPGKVERWAKDGWLKTDDSNIKATGKDYLFKKQDGNSGAPLVVLWLALGSVLFTLSMRFVNVWGFAHAVEIVRGVYDNPEEPGEVTHFQALSSALSATVGLGNIAGVTIAMTLGGPGAFFWMLMCGIFGMTSKFVECTLGQKYRKVKEDGTVLGGPMQYLRDGLAEIKIGDTSLGGLGVVLSILFAVMCILASFGGGNMFQSNQSAGALLSMIQKGDRVHLSELTDDIKVAAAAAELPDAPAEASTELDDLQKEKNQLIAHMEGEAKVFKPIFGIVLATFVALVIIGGIKRIGAAASKVVPTMCLLYIVACVVIIGMNLPAVPELVTSLFSQAFNAQALGGGFVGVLVIGVQRAAFSNEAGVGSAAIAHSAAKTDEPVREGAVALLGPFIDTVVVCSMTALVILITGAWNKPEWVIEQGLEGAALTSAAFGNQIWFFPYILTVAIVLFAFSTIISWSYYGERCWERLFGPGSIVVYRVIYVLAVVIGSFVSLEGVINFSDMMILSMAFPNVFGCLLLAPKVRADLLDYWQRYKAGEFRRFK